MKEFTVVIDEGNIVFKISNRAGPNTSENTRAKGKCDTLNDLGKDN
jgi:hypothetical protein